MSDVGYSPDYEVYLTPVNGVQIVTNDLSIAILKEMRYRVISLSDILSAIDVPKSTVKDSISKLMRMGIIDTLPGVPNVRNTYYRTIGRLLFCNDTDVDWQIYARTASSIRIMESGHCTSREDLSLYAASLTEVGVNIIQGLFNIGSALTFGMYRGIDVESLTRLIVEQAAGVGIECKVDFRNGLRLDLTSDRDISDTSLLITPMLGFVIDNSYSIMGYNLARDISLMVSESGHKVNIRIDPFEGTSDDLVTSMVFDNESYRLQQKFSIYSVRGESVIFTNETMIRIMEEIVERSLSVNELESRLHVPKATVYAGVSRLLEIGAIVLDNSSQRVKRYILQAEPVVYCTEPASVDRRRIQQVIRRFQDSELDYYSAVISLAKEVIDLVGLHFDRMFEGSGARTARTVLEHHSIPDLQTFLEASCCMVSSPDRAEIVSQYPVHVRIILSDWTLWGTWPTDFVRGFLREGIGYFTGDDAHAIIETVRGDGSPVDSSDFRTRQ